MEMSPPEENQIQRRQQKDFWLRLLPWLAVGAWLCLIGSLVAFALAKPEYETFFDRYSAIRRRPVWDRDIVRYILDALLAGLLISLAGIGVNLKRLRRKRDQLWYSLVFTALAALGGVVAYLLNF